MPVYSLLMISILFEVAGTSLMPSTQGLTRPLPSIALVLCYGVSFLLMTKVTQVLPTGLVYALWSSLGIVLTTLVGVVFLGQRLDPPTLLGLALILSGVVTLRLKETP
ncbi:MAG: multidrug efflux SMR transporter [Candidatus Eremiobacteraeota bacterium]|nr:multidrug efflux SMR transporter [Candidatus Eremiobacteraeota bacterium]